MGSQPHLQDARGGPDDRRSGWTDALFRGRSDRLQGTLTKTLGIALADLRHAVRMGSSQPGAEPSEASAISKAIPI